MAGPSGDAPLISVVTVCFNAAQTIERTFASVAAQDRTLFEYLVIDGGSADGTAAMIEGRADLVTMAISEPDDGIYDAWNKALKHARGRFIAFLGADDIYLPDALRVYADFIAANPGLDYISSRVRYGSRVVGKAYDWRRFRRYMTVAHVGSLHARALYDRVGVYDSRYRIAGDYELLLRAGPSLKAGFVDAVTVEMGLGGLSSGSAGSVFDETLRAKVSNGAASPVVARLDRLIARLKWRARNSMTAGAASRCLAESHPPGQSARSRSSRVSTRS